MKLWISKLIFDLVLGFKTWRKIRETRQVFGLTSSKPQLIHLSPGFAQPSNRSAVSEPASKKHFHWLFSALLLSAGIFLVINNLPKFDFNIKPQPSLVISEDPSLILPEPLTKMRLKDTLIKKIKNPPYPEYKLLPEGMHFIIVSKGEYKLRLYTLENNRWKFTRAWPILFGRELGRKKNKGDLKTPEGTYWIKNILPGPNVGSLYGSLIFTLNYPNRNDALEGRTGGGIWIHGNEFGTELQTTRGCIKLSNKDILDLFTYVKKATPVMILDGKNRNVKPEENKIAWIEKEYKHFSKIPLKAHRPDGIKFTLKEIESIAKKFVTEEQDYFVKHPAKELTETEIAEILKTINEWKIAWSNRHFSGYSLAYHNKFKSRIGVTRGNYLERKKGILAAQDSIYINFKDLKINPIKDSSASVKFLQEYKSFKSKNLSHSSTSKKELWLKKLNGKWKIIKE